MLSQANSFGLTGLNGFPVKVEAYISGGLHAYETVGLPDAAVKESKERVRSAMKNAGFEFPGDLHVTVSLAPADVRKEGSVYDLPIALALLSAEGVLKQAPLTRAVYLGELALNGDERGFAHGHLRPGDGGGRVLRAPGERRRGRLRGGSPDLSRR